MDFPEPEHLDCSRDLFHVHTYRCQHAEDVADETYVKKAIALRARSIWFTDHVPFPGDPFWLRMRYEQLEEYISTLEMLREKYCGQIEIHIGLETEYFPDYDRQGYYWKLAEDSRIELLLLGQHMAELEGEPGTYTFYWDESRRREKEHILLSNALCTGIRSGYFSAVAHPDRIFRRCDTWTPALDILSRQIITAAAEASIPLEINLASRQRPNNFREEFWKLAEGKVKTFFGLDAHSVKELSLMSSFP